jgi:hypothetical protein
MLAQYNLWSDLQIAVWRLEVLNVLKLENFIDWLKAKDADEIVGMAYRCDECPISNYLALKLPHLDCKVGRGQVMTQMPQGCYCNGSRDLVYLSSCDDLPSWVTQFVDRVDDDCMRKNDTYKKWAKSEINGMLEDFEFPVTKAQAQQIAQEIAILANASA